MTYKNLLLGSFLGTLAIIGAPANAQNYTYQSYQAPNAYLTVATDLTGDGRVVGYYSPNTLAYYGFIESDGIYKNVEYPTAGTPSTTIVAARGGKLLGTGGGDQFGFLIDATGVSTKIQVPDSQTTSPSSLNARGTVVGTYHNDLAGVDEAGFVLQNGVYKTFSVPNSHQTLFNDINDSGVIVGAYNVTAFGAYTGFTISNGKLGKIAFPGAASTVPTGINDLGQIVGYYYQVLDGAVSLFYFDGTTYTDFRPPNALACAVSHIKNSGEVVGQYTDLTTNVTQGFVGTPVNAGIQLPGAVH